MIGKKKEQGVSESWVLVDGRGVFRCKIAPGMGENGTIDIPIHPEDQFLTLATTDGGDGTVLDWSVFADPQLELRAGQEESYPDRD
jgi:hypothetical protein